jgi:radical SAM-linked protein
MKYLFTFEKGESVRWLGHLDILRTFERAIRRAELPIAFTQGFNPRERLAFASALSVGVTGDEEPATIELTDSLPGEEVVARLNANLPTGIRLRSALAIPDAGSRDLLNSYYRAELVVTCSCGPEATLEEAAAAARRLVAQTALPVRREREGRVKEVDIRPLIHDVRAESLQDGRITFIMLTALSGEGTAKPAEIVNLLAGDMPGLALRRVHRARVIRDDSADAEGALSTEK